MSLAFDVRVGEKVNLDHKDHGHIGSFRVDKKTGDAVRIIFDMPRAVIIRVLNHRASGVTFSLNGEVRGPLAHEGLKAAAI